AVYSGADLDAMRAAGELGATDPIGHGTHVAGSAAADDGSPDARTPYAGVAPEAGLLIVRLTRGNSQSIENDDLVRAVGFMFERADAEKKPCVVNLSLGSDFGPHDGSSLWEQALVRNVGPDKPGRVIVAAAGNSGAAPVLPIHQSVHVSPGVRTSVPIDSGDEGGNVSVWINFRQATGMKVGLRGPDEEWIAPLPEGQSAGRNRSSGSDQYNAAVVHGANAPESPIQAGSQAAVIGWQGTWPQGRYDVLLEGEGDVELYLQAVGTKKSRQAAFYGGVREGTINLPADSPTVLAVGATVNRVGWLSKNGQEIRVRAPTFDTAGDIALADATDLVPGALAFFSSAGPNALGVPKPEIAAPVLPIHQSVHVSPGVRT
ncbi:MAG: serine protease, partial [Proteobacteria bacterium]